jgi:cysteine synthase
MGESAVASLATRGRSRCPGRAAGPRLQTETGYPGPESSPTFENTHFTDTDHTDLRFEGAIAEEQAREMARRLARQEGIFAGTSAGLNVVATLQLAREPGAGRRVATVAVEPG